VAGRNEVLIKVRAASVNPLDWRIKVERPGRDVAGEVEAVGESVVEFKPGDAVFGICQGALAEYACARASSLVIKPEDLSFEQAAAVPIAGLTALQALRNKGQIQQGQNILINGASGGVGTFAVQLAKLFGAHVTGVCSTRNLELVRAVGADCVIDYTQVDFTRAQQRYDLLLDCVGNHPLSACRRVLKPNGKLVLVGAPKSLGRALMRIVKAIALSPFVSNQIFVFIAKSNKADLTTMGAFIATGKITPVIDREFPLRESPDAIRYLEQGHARGKVVVTVAHDN
jgi:NADPH:quinone reductase-like Zn-dependent oxidoreductase